MPDLLIVAQVITLGWSLMAWTNVGYAMRFESQSVSATDSLGIGLATPLFIALMGWLS